MIIINFSSVILKKINEEKIIRPFLINYPFTTKNIVLTLSFSNSLNSNANNLAYALLTNNKIIYCAKNVEKNILVDLHEESYEDALKILEKSISL
ncbi:MAG: hypothetical protein Tsb0015_08450 [Simkaniaceae bacterium]